MPAPAPVHFGATGAADGWVDKGPAAIVLPVGIVVFMAVCMTFARVTIVRSKRGVDAGALGAVCIEFDRILKKCSEWVGSVGRVRVGSDITRLLPAVLWWPEVGLHASGAETDPSAAFFPKPLVRLVPRPLETRACTQIDPPHHRCCRRPSADTPPPVSPEAPPGPSSCWQRRCRRSPRVTRRSPSAATARSPR